MIAHLIWQQPLFIYTFRNSVKCVRREYQNIVSQYNNKCFISIQLFTIFYIKMATKSILNEHYEKGEVTVKDKDPKADFKNLPDNVFVVRVKRGSKVKNIMGFVEKTLKDENNRQLVFSGCGDAIEKTITCAEITKTKFKDLHQITKLSVLSVLEFWEPKQPDLDRLQVTREIPTVSILLSKDPLDSNELGYQAPSNKDRSPKKSFKRKKTDQRPKKDTEAENSMEEKVLREKT